MPRQLRIQYPGATYHVMSRGWPPAELASRRKHDPAKLEIAARLRRETTLPVKQTTTRLHLGTPKSASVRLLRAARQNVWGDPAQRSLGL